ncbi:MAG: glycoside hydrolase family 16 protein [Paramuribaculum sp.]|nr:glycoside hydrolase family 16 protein [Paramuribaculum sp.]
MKSLLITLLVISLSLFTTLHAAPPKWVLEWEDNFDGSEPDSAIWSRIDRGHADWNNYMTKADTCYDMRNGNIVLKGIAAYEGCNDSVPYLTGGIYTKDKKGFSNGRIEVCAKLKGATGAWPAIWMLPYKDHKDGQWPRGGEIDIMERLNYDSIAYQTIHSHYTYNLNIKEPKSGSVGSINPEEYNVYAVELYPDSISFYINDSHTFTYPRIDTDTEGQFPFSNGSYYLLIDMQLGGKWVGEVDPADLPVEMLIDYVRFYKKEE